MTSMRYVAFLFVMVLVAAGTTARITQTEARAESPAQGVAPGPRVAPTDSVVQFLITAAATDFRLHGPSGPLRFREVRLGHVMIARSDTQYRLCGQFLQTKQGVDSQWTLFATVKTSGYEQLIGGQASVLCQDTSVIWDKTGDLSSSLQNRFDSLR